MSDLVLNTFGLRRHPFTVDIDVDGLFAFQSFQQGALRMEQAARQKGSILIVADPGTGKTALLRSVVKRLSSSSFSVFEQLVPAVQSPVRAMRSLSAVPCRGLVNSPTSTRLERRLLGPDGSDVGSAIHRFNVSFL